MSILIVLAGLVSLALAVPRWGADTRDAQDWRPRCDGRRCKAV